MSVKVHSGKSVLDSAKTALGGVVGHDDAPRSPIKITGDQSLDDVPFEPWIAFGVQFGCPFNGLETHFVLDPEIRELLDFVVDAALV